MSGGGIVNIIFIIFKVGLVMIMMVNGMAANFAKNNAVNKSGQGEINPIFRLFIYWCLLLVMLLLYEFVDYFKKIYFLYIMLIGAGLAQVRGVHIFINKVAIYHTDSKIERNMVNAIYVAYGILFILIGMFNDADVGAFCQKDKEYPVIYQIYFVFWLCFFFLCAYFYKMDFFINEDKLKAQDDKELALEQELLNQLDDDDSYKKMHDKDGDGILDKLQVDEDGDGEMDAPITTSQVLRKMINRFALFHCFFFFYVVGLLIASYRVNDNEGHSQVDYFRCDVGFTHEELEGEFNQAEYDSRDIADDQVWIPSPIGGKLIGLAHVIMIMMGSVQAEQAFYTVPHHIGYYNTADTEQIEKSV